MKRVLSFVLAMVFVFTLTACDGEKPVITLNGSEEMTLEVGEDYVEPGAIVDDNKDDDLEATITGEVDVDTLGTYTVSYDAVDSRGNEADTMTRTIHVVDTQDPVITMNGEDEIIVAFEGMYTEPGATANDNYDGDISVTISGSVNVNALGSYTLTYQATDSSGNTDSMTRMVYVVDQDDPLITLNGDAEVTIEVGGTYSELGAVVVDNVDTGLTAQITGTVDTDTVGDYTVTYLAMDTEGNSSSITRTVHVVDTQLPVVSLLGNEMISMYEGTPFMDPGAVAVDNYDTTLTVDVVGMVNPNVPGEFRLAYTATDSSGNVSLPVFRTVTVIDVDNDAPLLHVIGNPMRYMKVGDPFVDEGYHYYDQSNVNVSVSGSVDTSTPGIYTITYTATDDLGYQTVKTRMVVVREYFRWYTSYGETTPFCFSPEVCVQRGTSGPMYNNVVYPTGLDYATAGYSSMEEYTRNIDVMEGAVFSYGTCDDVETWGTFNSVTLQNPEVGKYRNVRYKTFCVRTLETPSMWEIHFESWYGGSSDNFSFTYIEKPVPTEPYIVLNGDSVVTLEVGDTYTELGAMVYDDVTVGLTPLTDGTVDTSTPGLYEITYTAMDGDSLHATPAIRYVIVLDDPVHFSSEGNQEDCISDLVCISRGGGGPLYNTLTYPDGLNPGGTMEMYQFIRMYDPIPYIVFTIGTPSREFGAYTMGELFSDLDYEGDDMVQLDPLYMHDISTGEIYLLDITVWTSGSGSYVEYDRWLIHTSESPTVVLNGDDTMMVHLGTPYVELGAMVFDDVDTDLTVEITGTVDDTIPGIYTLVYTVTDNDGNQSEEVIRTVVVGTPEIVRIGIGISDCFTNGVCFTRADRGPFYNDVTMDSPEEMADANGTGVEDIADEWDIMLGMEFALGICDVNAEFTSYGYMVDEILDDDFPDMLGEYFCGRTILTDEYYQFKLLSWGSRGSGHVIYERTRLTFSEKPHVILYGDREMYLDINEAFVEPGYLGYDAQDGELEVIVNSNLNITMDGTYLVTYQVIDSDGYVSDMVTRTIHVGGNEIVFLELGEEYCFNENSCISRDQEGPFYDSNQYPDGFLNYLDEFAGATTSMYRKSKDLTPSLEFAWGTCSVLSEFTSANEMNDIEDYRFGEYQGETICVRTKDTFELFNVYFHYWLSGDDDNEEDIVRLVFEVEELGVQIMPEVTLNGHEEVHLLIGESYHEAGAMVHDPMMMNPQAVIGGDVVDVNVEGIYVVTYTYTTPAMVDYVVERTVYVSDTHDITITTFDPWTDCITTTVCIYRDYEGAWYNQVDHDIGYLAYAENIQDTYDEMNLMSGIDFALGACDVATDFMPFNELIPENIRSTVMNNTLCGRTREEFMLFEFDITNWYHSNEGLRLEYSRTYIGIYEAPIIDLLGDKDMLVDLDSTFTDPGYEVRDNFDQDLTVTITGDTVDTSVVGTYLIHYSVTDSDMNMTTVTRTVMVVDLIFVDYYHGDPADCFTPTFCMARDTAGPMYNTLLYPTGLVDAVGTGSMGSFTRSNDVTDGSVWGEGEYDPFMYLSYSRNYYSFNWREGDLFTVVSEADGRVFQLVITKWEQRDGTGLRMSYYRYELPVTHDFGGPI